MALPTRADDINVAAWLKLLTRINDEAPGFEGANAALVLTEQVFASATTLLDSISADAYVQMGLAPVRDQMSLLGSRISSYRSALDAVAGPVTAKQVDDSERVRLALLTGWQPPPLPALPMGDAALAASLYNQVLHAAVLDAEQAARAGAVVPGPQATADKLREWLTQGAHQLEESAPGEPRTARDKVVAAIEDALLDVDKLLKQAGEILWTLLKWTGIGLAAFLAAMLLLQYRKR